MLLLQQTLCAQLSQGGSDGVCLCVRAHSPWQAVLTACAPCMLCVRAGLLTGEEAHQKKARVGLTPGLTRQVAGLQVCAEPAVYVLDSPGIMVPAVPSDEVGYRLALAGARRRKQGWCIAC